MSSTQSRREYIDLLKEYCQNCEKDMKYGLAEKTKRRIETLKRQEGEDLLTALNTQQEQERLVLEDSQVVEFREFSREWENRVNSQKEYTVDQLKAIDQILKDERAQLINRLDKELPVQAKPSSEVLNLICIEKALVKQQEYAEAKLIKKKVKELKTAEQRSWASERQKKVMLQVSHLEKKQMARRNALELKLKAMEDELEKMRLKQIETLLLKYHNIKRSLQNYQATQQNQLNTMTLTAAS